MTPDTVDEPDLLRPSFRLEDWTRGQPSYFRRPEFSSPSLPSAKDSRATPSNESYLSVGNAAHSPLCETEGRIELAGLADRPPTSHDADLVFRSALRHGPAWFILAAAQWSSHHTEALLPMGGSILDSPRLHHAEVVPTSGRARRIQAMRKKIGILGGMSPESTIAYYQHITRTYTERFGDYGYPEIIIYSVSFQPYVDWPRQERWDLVAQGLGEAARRLEVAGADFIVMATNTMHLVFDQVQACVQVPMLSLLDAVAEAILARGMKKVGLLGTQFTMEKTFYQDALSRRGITVLVPDNKDRQYVNAVIYDELVAGQIRSESRAGFIGITRGLAERGAQGVILGCTEIPLLLTETDAAMPIFDTTAIHAEAALRYALEG
jgi:aspartate racemase